MKLFIFSMLVYGLFAMTVTNVPDPESPKYSFNWGFLGFTTVIGGFLMTTFRATRTKGSSFALLSSVPIIFLFGLWLGIFNIVVSLLFGYNTAYHINRTLCAIIFVLIYLIGHCLSHNSDSTTTTTTSSSTTTVRTTAS
eukprot:TRINITY_DN16549_c0_g1_i1.p2 TRINITY_DN16549_c0_g1~~TRINITY_DN16549_c0_g1_i1.p2  ORF type:complete len:139 (+),score=19.61 TRINITY_DN16549_c0_g1_i1:100-516(+)